MNKLSGWIPFVTVLAVSAWSIWPVLSRPLTAWAWGGDDGIITWQMNQTIQKIPGGLNHLFEGNIFYPYQKTAALHMLLVPSALIGYLPVKLSGNPVAAYNTVLIVAQFMTVTVLYLWLKELTKNPWAAAVGTLAFALSQIRMFFDVHIHMWIMQWLLLSCWMIWRYGQNRQIWQLYAAGFFLAVQCWESIYQAFWIGFTGVIILGPKIPDLLEQKKHLWVIFLGILLLVSPVVYAYGSVYREFGYAGSIREAAHFAMSVNDLWGKFLSPGLFILLVTAIIRKGLFKEKWLWNLLVFGAVMALGPALKWQDTTLKILDKWWIPLPYGVLYYLVPGVSVLRSVHRYIWLTALAASGLIAVGINKRIKPLVLGALLLVVIAGGARLTPRGDFPKPTEYPAVYRWLKDQPAEVILEYPVFTWADGTKHWEEMNRMVFSLLHRKYLINGAAGFMPPEREKFLAEIQRGYPSAELDRKLSEMGADYVIVHKRETGFEKLSELETMSGQKKVWEDAESAVYKL